MIHILEVNFELVSFELQVDNSLDKGMLGNDGAGKWRLWAGSF